ncbi:testis-specific protein 10-interacting protein [Chelonoidis abingdonii]|uniref:testis-specific protein 10-interacting protein n=1 Tax=Chelonoidis abingdonii TaxID=106734 RepID=UPI0013F21403|nr:testis-specific protein 10-interacting protein [Chelonoidis abingdonii]
MLGAHRRSMFTNACISPSLDSSARAPGTLYQKKGRVHLLGLLSDSLPQEEEVFNSGDGIVVLMRKGKRKGSPRDPTSGRRGRQAPQCKMQEPRVRDTSDENQDSAPSAGRQTDVSEDTLLSKPAHSCTPDPLPHNLRPSFPFQWMWEEFSLNGRALLPAPSLDKVKKGEPRRAPNNSPRENVRPTTTDLQGHVDQRAGSSQGRSSTEGSRIKRAPQSSPSTLSSLYWKMEARSEARKRQLQEERRHWLQLAQQLLSLEEAVSSPAWEAVASAQQLRARLRAEVLCLATEPQDPSPREHRRKGRGLAPKDKMQFQPIINQTIPDFETLHRRFQEQLEKRKVRAKLTICKPFHFHVASSSQHQPGDELRDWEQQQLRQLWSFHCGSQSCSEFDPLPSVPPTRASDKRQEATRLLLLEWERREKQEKRRAEQRRVKQQQVQREVAKCLAAYSPPGSLAQTTQRKREELRRLEQQRMAEYDTQLREIQERVESRPYLFERVMQTNARLAVERRFSQVLAALGINERLLWRHAGHLAKDNTARTAGRVTQRRSRSLS